MTASLGCADALEGCIARLYILLVVPLPPENPALPLQAHRGTCHARASTAYRTPVQDWTRTMAEAASPSESTTSLLLHQPSLNHPATSSSDAGPALPFLKVNIIVTGKRRTALMHSSFRAKTWLTMHFIWPYAVVGCASTVGRAICHELARQGANLALTDISKGGGQDLCMELQKAKYRGSLLFSSFDPKDSERVGAFVRSVSKTLKRLDALVNCAMHSPEVRASISRSYHARTLTYLSDRTSRCTTSSCKHSKIRRIRI